MLAALYAYIPRISTACNLIAVLIVVCYGMLSEATGAVRDVHFSSYGSNSLVLSKTIVRNPLYAGLQNIAMDTDGAYRGSSPPAEGWEFKPGPGREFELSRSMALAAIGKTLEAGRFSIASIAESLGCQPHYRDAGIWMERFARCCRKSIRFPRGVCVGAEQFSDSLQGARKKQRGNLSVRTRLGHRWRSSRAG